METKIYLVVCCWENSTICSIDLSITKKFQVKMIESQESEKLCLMLEW